MYLFFLVSWEIVWQQSGIRICRACSRQRARFLFFTQRRNEKMSCKNCGQEPEDAFCPACGRSRRDDDKFCPNCGHRFTDSPAPPADAQGAAYRIEEQRKDVPLLQESRFGSENAPSKTIQSFFRCAHRIPACALGLFRHCFSPFLPRPSPKRAFRASASAVFIR